MGFNPRTPCGVRLVLKWGCQGMTRFQSTHSLRSATSCPSMPQPDTCRFNPRTPCGVRHRPGKHAYEPRGRQSAHSWRSAALGGRRIRESGGSVHALLAECDPHLSPIRLKFPVSIHALLAECDYPSKHEPRRKSGFNPRTPCGVRPPNFFIRASSDRCQSTHSLRSATNAMDAMA